MAARVLQASASTFVRSRCPLSPSLPSSPLSAAVRISARPKSSNPKPATNTSTSDADANGGSSGSGLSSYIGSLRLRAASALTSSLPADERDALLRSLGAVDETAARDGAGRSIGEAVAAAVREEAQRSESRWRREREVIEARAERAALERLEAERAVAEAAATTAEERRRGMERWRKEVEEEEKEERAAAADHPILGRPVVDLGYKRVHVVSARSLAAIPIWEKQRVYRHDRARLMAADKIKTADIGLPGIVTLHEAEDGQLKILDGQHRVGMMAILQEKSKLGGSKGKKEGDGDGGEGGPFDLDLDRVLVEVFPVPQNSDVPRLKHAETIFTEINKAEPVKLVDMPGVARGGDRKVIDGAAESLRSAFPDMFKPSQRCRVPHLNVDNLRDALFAADVLKRHSIKSDRALVDWMMEKNAELARRYAEDGANGSRGATKAVSKSALAKAEKFNFFLGLDSSWLYQ